MKISARNNIQGTVTKIQEGVVTAHVTVDIGNGQAITSSITMESLKALGIEPGQTVYTIIKASDVMIGVDD